MAYKWALDRPLYERLIYFQGYVSCAWGVDKVGYVVVTYGVFDAGFSLGLSLLIAKIGRVAIFLIGATLNLAVIMFLFLWRPNSEQAYFFFIVAALWGISDAVWQTQINGNEPD